MRKAQIYEFLQPRKDAAAPSVVWQLTCREGVGGEELLAAGGGAGGHHVQRLLLVQLVVRHLALEQFAVQFTHGGSGMKCHSSGVPLGLLPLLGLLPMRCFISGGCATEVFCFLGL